MINLVPNDRTKKILNTYLRRLTNLSGNNRSVFLPRLAADQFIDLHSFSFLKGKNSFAIIQSLIAGKPITIAAELDSRLEANNEASSKLKKLQRLDHFLYEERGTKDLHVGWPFVRGRFLDDTFVRCPLIYFPVELALEKGNWILRPRPNAEMAFNKSFLLAYAYYNKTQPANELLEEDFEEADRNSAVFRTYIYQVLQRNNLEINFNPDNYRDELVPFATFKKEEFESETEKGRLKLFPEAVLGIFPQAGSSLVPDYLQLLEQDAIHDLDEFFSQRTNANAQAVSNFLPLVKEEKVYTVFPMDVWQENALKGIKLGHSLVVQGPPGTGKSQLICNLISDQIANKKRVLVVCQKRVALDVVYHRLKEKRLDDFVGLVHDFREDRKELYQKIARQAERVDEYKTRNNSLDAIQLERKFYDVSRRIDQLVDELESFKKYLFDDADAGISVKQLYLMSDTANPVIELKQELSYMRWTEAQAFRRKLKTYARLADRFLIDHPWKGRKSFAGCTVASLPIIKDVLKQIRPWFLRVNEQIQARINASISWEQAEAFLEKQTQVDELVALLDDEAVYQSMQHMAHEADEDTSALWLANVEKMLVECFDEEGPELSVAAAQLGQFQLALYRSMKSRRNLFGLIRWEFFSTDKFLIKRTLVANHLQNNRKGFRALENKLDRRLNLEHNLSKLRSAAWLGEIPAFGTALEVKQWMQVQQKAIRAKSILNAFRGLKTILNPTYHSRAAFLGHLKNIFSQLADLPSLRNTWLQWLTPMQIRELAEDDAKTSELEKSLQHDFDTLCEFDNLQESLLPHEQQIIGKLYDKLGQWDYQLIDHLFLNSLALAWIDHIEQKHPELRMVSTGALEQREEELKELIRAKESSSTEILLMRAREGVVDDMEFNRLNNRITYRDLLHQLTKKKKIWPIRKVMAEFEDEVFKLAPCWLASPESVSSIFPMKELFDLVIFDEASQCFAERGIPALYRGKQAVIAGDPQQLQPSDLYLARWEEETDDPDAELTSLLELGNRYIPKVMLQGHYRSQSPELIQFSNMHFYENKLHLLPDCQRLNKAEAPIQYIHVGGVWENNCNRAEAEKVVALVCDLTRQHPEKEIGVITFNAPQQALILDLLDQEVSQQRWQRPDTLFVKNIENVQGDEKDIIIFSVGYAPDKKGKLTVQFGSLSQAGGENRLNVAVTRAREKTMVVASIDGNELQVDNTRNDGPKLLREYLLFARQVSEGQAPPAKPQPASHAAEWYLKTQLRDGLLGTHAADERFPFADFVLKKEAQYHGLLLTDDDLYFQNPSAKSVHAQLPRLFQEKNWKQKMLYSRNWWLDKEKFWNEIGKFAS
ncbi:MAG: DEAD/DEAH box helicase [Bacteroidota bacterium]